MRKIQLICIALLCASSAFAETPVATVQTLFPVSIGDGVGFIDKAGRLVVNPEFMGPCPYSEGMTVVTQDGKYGCLDENGTIVVAPQYERICRNSTKGSRGSRWGESSGSSTERDG